MQQTLCLFHFLVCVSTLHMRLNLCLFAPVTLLTLLTHTPEWSDALRSSVSCSCDAGASLHHTVMSVSVCAQFWVRLHNTNLHFSTAAASYTFSIMITYLVPLRIYIRAHRNSIHSNCSFMIICVNMWIINSFELNCKYVTWWAQ